MGIYGGEQPPRVLRALEALRKAAGQLHQQAAAVAESKALDDAAEVDVCSSPSMRALLELERQSEGLLGHDPDLEPLSRLLWRLRAAASTCASPRSRRPSSFLQTPLASLFRLLGGEGDGEDEEVARVAAGIEEEIQAWIDRENAHRVASALESLLISRPPAAAGEEGGDRSKDGEDETAAHIDEPAVASLLSAMESRLRRGFDPRYQSAMLRSGAFPLLLAALTSSSSSPSSASKLVRESCASAVAAAVRFNPAVFVGPILMSSSSVSSVVRSLAGMATPTAARALEALVSAIRTPLVDEMEARGEIPLVVGLLRKPPDLAAAAMGAAMGLGRHGRREAVQAMVDAGVVERLVELELEYGADEEDEEEQEDRNTKRKIGVRAGEVGIRASCSSFHGCVARFAVSVGTGRGMGRRDKREARAELVRRLRAAAEADARAGNILAEVLWWDIT